MIAGRLESDIWTPGSDEGSASSSGSLDLRLTFGDSDAGAAATKDLVLA